MDNEIREEAPPPLWRNPSLFAAASFIGLAAAVLLVGFPGIDFAVSDLFFSAQREAFVFREQGFVEALRVAFRLVFWTGTLLALVGLGMAIARGRRLRGFGFPHWLFVILCVIVGPGLVANSILKDNWHRARPAHIERYGGDQIYTPPLVRSDQCARNCSFVAGEAAAIYGLGFAFAMLARRRRRDAILAACLAGSVIGLVRIGQGGHFFSDVVFAGVFMLLVVQGTYWLVLAAGGRALAHQGPAHERLMMWSNAAGLWTQRMTATARERAEPALRQAAQRLKPGRKPPGPGAPPSE